MPSAGRGRIVAPTEGGTSWPPFSGAAAGSVKDPAGHLRMPVETTPRHRAHRHWFELELDQTAVPLNDRVQVEFRLPDLAGRISHLMQHGWELEGKRIRIDL